jgi:hypothetical protein
VYLVNSWAIPFLLGFLGGFLVDIFILDYHYRACFKAYRDELANEYGQIIRRLCSQIERMKSR